MRTLPELFESKGYKHTQIYVCREAYIYERKSDGGRAHYEVFERKISKAHPMSENQQPIERYPKDEHFGKWAWSCMDLTSAKNRVEEIKNRVKARNQKKAA